MNDLRSQLTAKIKVMESTQMKQLPLPTSETQMNSEPLRKMYKSQCWLQFGLAGTIFIID